MIEHFFVNTIGIELCPKIKYNGLTVQTDWLNAIKLNISKAATNPFFPPIRCTLYRHDMALT